MNFAAARRAMVEGQLRVNRISDPAVLDAFLTVPREMFVPRGVRGQAYGDGVLDVGGGRVLLSPLVLARLISSAVIGPSDMVLAVGDVTGYAASILSRLAAFVVALDSEADWPQRGSALFSREGIANVEAVRGALPRGYFVKAPYDVILVFGGVPEIPGALQRQLADKGRLVAIERLGNGPGRGVMVLRSGDTWGRRTLFDAFVPPLPGF